MTVPMPENNRDIATEIDLLHDLAALVKERFTPGVFSCSCNGLAPDCAKTLREDPRVWERREAVQQIADMLLDMAREREDTQQAAGDALEQEERAARWAQ